ncbi:MAG: hypothetical protein NVSMB65_02010 [Chloroflexota bacterium]
MNANAAARSTPPEAGSRPAPTPWKRVAGSVWLRYGISLLLILIIAKKIDWAPLTNGRVHLAAGNLVLAGALTVPFLLLKAARWYLLLRYGGLRATFGEALGSLVVGMSVALITPARLGELTRAAYISDPRKLRIGGLVMVDKLYDVIVLALLSVVGAWAWIGHWAGLALLAGGIVAAYVVVLPRHVAPLLSVARLVGPLRARAERTVASLEGLSSRTALACLALTALSFAIVLLQFWVILQAWRPTGFDVVANCFPLVVLTNAVPITIAGFGLREGTAVWLLAHYGVTAAFAFAGAFLMFFLNTAVPGFLGAALAPVLRGGRKGTPEHAAGL